MTSVHIFSTTGLTQFNSNTQTFTGNVQLSQRHRVVELGKVISTVILQNHIPNLSR